MFSSNILQSLLYSEQIRNDQYPFEMVKIQFPLKT